MVGKWVVIHVITWITGVETIKRQTTVAYGWSVVGQSVVAGLANNLNIWHGQRRCGMWLMTMYKCYIPSPLCVLDVELLHAVGSAVLTAAGDVLMLSSSVSNALFNVRIPTASICRFFDGDRLQCSREGRACVSCDDDFNTTRCYSADDHLPPRYFIRLLTWRDKNNNNNNTKFI